LTIIINIILASHKRTDELKPAYDDETTYLVEHDEFEIGIVFNPIGTLQRPRDTRWGSYLKFISSLMKMFSSTCIILGKLIDEGGLHLNGEVQILHMKF